jgi:ubiquitin carboxyl-terminal hydrolase 36/42
MQVSRYSEEEVLDITSYLLFYVKKGLYPWFSSLLEKKKIPLDGSAEAERGPDELHKDKEESTLSDGQDGSDGLCKPVVNGNGPNLVGDANGNTLSDELEQLSCCLRGISGETQELSCVTGSGGKNGYVDIVTEPLEMKEDGSPRGSLLDKKEMKGSTEEDNRGTQVRSPGKNDNTFSLLGRSSPEPSTNSSLHGKYY